MKMQQCFTAIIADGADMLFAMKVELVIVKQMSPT